MCDSMSKAFACLLLSIFRLWGCFLFTPFLICVSFSGNEVSWVLILWEYLSVFLLKEKNAKESETLIYFNFLCFFLIPQLEETNPSLWRILSSWSEKENSGLHLLLNITLIFFYIYILCTSTLCMIEITIYSIWAI